MAGQMRRLADVAAGDPSGDARDRASNGGDCVETASGERVILVRDTADRDGATLSVPADTWRAFTASLR
jgi:hypothetical protein